MMRPAPNGSQVPFWLGGHDPTTPGTHGRWHPPSSWERRSSGTNWGSSLVRRDRFRPSTFGADHVAAAVVRHGGEDGMGSGRRGRFDAPPCGEDLLRPVDGNLGNRGTVGRFRDRTELLGCAEGRAAVRGLRVHQVGLRLFQVQEDRIHDVDDAGGHFLRHEMLRRPPRKALRQPVGLRAVPTRSTPKSACLRRRSARSSCRSGPRAPPPHRSRACR